MTFGRLALLLAVAMLAAVCVAQASLFPDTNPRHHKFHPLHSNEKPSFGVHGSPQSRLTAEYRTYRNPADKEPATDAAALDYYTVLFNATGTGSFSIVPGIDMVNGIVYGAFADLINATGWGRLFLHTISSPRTEVLADEQIAWVAGYLESYLCHVRIFQGYQNFYARFFGPAQGPPSAKLLQFFADQEAWTRANVASYARTSSFWATMSVFMAQFDGLVAGYQAFADPANPMDVTAWYLWQSAGELYELIPATKPHSERPHYASMSREELRRVREEKTSCSVLIRNSFDGSDIYVGHTTWTDFGSMLRVFKYYDFSALRNADFVGHRVSFSAKPGVLFSKDDFYVLWSQHVVVTETTNAVLNDALLDLIVPQSLLCWQRVLVANSLATDGESWTRLFGYLNSGTYNNQFMVVDMRRFVAGGQPQSGFLWIIEQLPGTVESADETATYISNGMAWPSYNVPFFPRIYNLSGYLQAYEQHGDEYSFTKCPRAQIFWRNMSMIGDMPSMEKILQYNNWQVDPLSLGDPSNAIAARSDLTPNPAGRAAFGGIDCKITSYKRVMGLPGVAPQSVEARSGPTYDQQPAFTWDDPQWAQIVHNGQPTTFRFPFQTMVPDQ